MTGQSLKIEKKIKADRTRLFRAWLEPDDFARWFIPSNQTRIGAVTMDPRVGGSFCIEMFVDGKILPHCGEFRVIEEPAKLVFTWRSWATNDRDTLVTLTFDSIGDGTLLTLVHDELIDETQREKHRGGWTGILEGLELREGDR